MDGEEQMPTPRQDYAIAKSGGRIYAFGGELNPDAAEAYLRCRGGPLVRKGSPSEGQRVPGSGHGELAAASPPGKC